MVKRKFWHCAAVIFLVLGGCASSGKIVGTVYVAGNEPFTWVALEASDGTVYRLEATNELEQRLRTMQWKKIEVEFSKEIESLAGKALMVRSVKEIEQ